MILMTMVVLMILLLFLGMHVAFGLGFIGLAGLYFLEGGQAVVGILSTSPFRSAANFTLTAIPMFILMAEFVSRSKVIELVFEATVKWLERLTGGLAIATVMASALMGAMCGSSAASAATMAKICVPELIKRGYNAKFSAGIVATSGTLAIMIPPSLSFIIYGMVTETSIARLFIAGIIPGLLTSLIYSLGINAWCKFKPGLAPTPTRTFTWADRWRSLLPIWPFLILIGMVFVALYSGLATATEAAAVGAFGALVISLLLRRINLKDIGQAAVTTVQTTTMIFAIIIGAMLFGYLITMAKGTEKLIQFVAAMNVDSWVIMVFVVIVYLFLGCIMESSSIMLITLPVSFPLVTSLGYDPIWFGVIIVKLIEIGLITPPVGVNVYIVSAATGVPLAEAFRGTGLMLCLECVSLIILLAFPALSTWLPSMMKF